MTLQIDRFEVKSIGGANKEKVNIIDHATDKSVVLLNVFDDFESNKSLAEALIPVIEDSVVENESKE